MELLNQANLLIAIAAPIVMIIVINAVLQRTGEQRPLFKQPAPRIEAPAKVEPAIATAEAANEAHHDRAA